MTLQQAIDIIHDIREHFPHLAVFLFETDRKFRDNSTIYTVSIFTGVRLDNCVLLIPTEYEYDYLKTGIKLFCKH